MFVAAIATSTLWSRLVILTNESLSLPSAFFSMTNCSKSRSTLERVESKDEVKVGALPSSVEFCCLTGGVLGGDG